MIRPLTILLCGLCLLSSAWASQSSSQSNRWNPVELELIGPLESVVIVCGDAGETRIEIPLMAGEKRSLRVPLPIRPEFLDLKAALTWSGAGLVRWGDMAGAQGGASISLPNLPLPTVPRDQPKLPSFAALGLLGLTLLLFFLRRKTSLQMLVALVGSTLLFLQVGTTDPNQPGAVRVLAMGTNGPWTIIDSGLHSMPAEPGRSIHLEAKPIHLPVNWRVSESGGRLQIEAQCRGGLLRKISKWSPGMWVLTPELNAWANLQSLWVRQDSGLWSARGSWLLGEPLPSEVNGASDPPGWLIEALPQGAEFWVGLFELGSQLGGGTDPADQVWLRMRR